MTSPDIRPPYPRPHLGGMEDLSAIPLLPHIFSFSEAIKDQIVFLAERKIAIGAIAAHVEIPDRANLERVAGHLVRAKENDLPTVVVKLQKRFPSVGLTLEKLRELHSHIQVALKDMPSHYELFSRYRREEEKRRPTLLHGRPSQLDFTEWSKSPKDRGLQTILLGGISISIIPATVSLLRNNLRIAVGGTCSLLEQLKNSHCIEVVANGISFGGSTKLALSSHDLFDHIYTFHLMERSGVFTRYRKLFRSLGNPQRHDIFSREAELFCTVPYGWREYIEHVKESKNGELPDLVHSKGELVQLLSSKRGQTKNQRIARHLLSTLPDDDPMIHKLCYIYSGVRAEMLERKRTGDPFSIEGDRIRFFRHSDPEFLALMVELVWLLDSPKSRSKEVLLNINLHIENLLVGASKGLGTALTGGPSLFWNPPDPCHLPEARIDWLKDHLGCTALRSGVCNI